MTPYAHLIACLDAQVAVLERLVEESQREQAMIVGLSVAGMRDAARRKALLVEQADETARETALALSVFCVSAAVADTGRVRDVLPALSIAAREAVEARLSCLRSLAAAQEELNVSLRALVCRSRAWLGEHLCTLLKEAGTASGYGAGAAAAPSGATGQTRGFLLEARV